MHAPEDVEVALDKTLSDLETPYLDLYLVSPVIWARKSVTWD